MYLNNLTIVLLVRFTRSDITLLELSVTCKLLCLMYFVTINSTFAKIARTYFFFLSTYKPFTCTIPFPSITFTNAAMLTNLKNITSHPMYFSFLSVSVLLDYHFHFVLNSVTLPRLKAHPFKILNIVAVIIVYSYAPL